MNSYSLALVPLALAASAHAQAPVEPTVLIDTADVLGSPPLPVAVIYPIVSGPTRGYAAALGLRVASSGPVDRGLIWGDLVDDGTTTPGILRETRTIQGRVQTAFSQLAIGGTSIAYDALALDSIGIQRSSLWIDDDLQYFGTDPSPIAGWDYLGVGRISMSDTGVVVVGAPLIGSGPGNTSEAILEFPSGTVLIAPNSTIGGTSETVELATYPSISPNGAHVVAAVLLSSGRRAVVLDGAIHRIDGAPVIEGELIPPRAGGDGVRRWALPLPVEVDDLGHVTIAETGPGTLIVMPPSTVVHRGSRLLGHPDVYGGTALRNNRKTEVGPRGVVASAWRDRFQPPATTDFVYGDRWLTRGGTPGVDVDGDGSADPGWQLTRFTSLEPQIAVTARGEVLMIHGIEEPGVAVRNALLRFRPQVGGPSCDAQPNSSGRPARLSALGLDRVASNDLLLRANDLPRNTVGYFLASTTPGFVPGAGGSMGDLCLGGSIGRYAGNVLSSGDVGAFTMPLDLSSIAQPTLSVPAMPGQTWHFQAWFRDAVGGAATSNFTEAVAVPLR